MFEAVKKFMEASGQTTGEFNPEQVELYAQLVNEEMVEMAESWHEVYEAMEGGDGEDIREALSHHLKEINDLLWVVVGFGLSFGLPMEAGMAKVATSNMAKIIDGKVRKNPETGKVMKPEGWTPPDYTDLIEKLMPMYRKKLH